MKFQIGKNFAIAIFLIIHAFGLANAQELQAPAYPLITHDPYFSIWSMGDKINSTTTMHWTNKAHSLSGIINVDGINYRF